MTRVDRAIEMVRALDAAKAEVARIEAELAEMLGEDGGGSSSAATKQETAAVAGRAGRGERLNQVAQLASQGLDVATIATQLGVSLANVRLTLARARKKGLVPKAGSTR